MRNESLINFSLIIPSKNRPEYLKKCLDTFFQKAAEPHFVEAIVMLDVEDIEYCHEMQDFFLHSEHNVCTVIKKNGSVDFNRHYMNHGAQCAHGHYMWVLNDECEMVTDEWDRLIREAVNDPNRNELQRSPLAPLYIMTADDTHTHEGSFHTKGSSFPILTAPFVEAINGLLFPEIQMWGSDIAMYHFFQEFFPDLIVDMSDRISVLHHTYFNGRRDKDTTNNTGPTVSRQQGLGDKRRQEYKQMVDLAVRIAQNPQPPQWRTEVE